MRTPGHNLTRDHLNLFIWVVLIFELLTGLLALVVGRHAGYGYAFSICFWLGLVLAVIFLCIFLLNLAGIVTISFFNRLGDARFEARRTRAGIQESCNSPMLEAILRNADHVDVKTVEGWVTLPGFVAAMLSYRPPWLIVFYAIRKRFVRILGMRQEDDPAMLRPLKAADVPFEPGKTASFFIVRHAEQERCWIAETPEEKHLKAFICIFRRETGHRTSRFDIMTVVHYKHWTGPLYFNVIRPFHHIVVKRMALAGVRHGERA